MDSQAELTLQMGILMRADGYHRRNPSPSTAAYLRHCRRIASDAARTATAAGVCRIK
jgi:hypothetical protein